MTDELELDPLFAEDDGDPLDLDTLGPAEPTDTPIPAEPDLDAAVAAKEAAFEAYRAKGDYKLNDVVHTTDKGFYFVCDFWPDGKPKFRHRVKPNPAFRKGKPSPNPLGKHSPVKDLAAHVREQTGNGQELYDFYLKVMRDSKAPLKDRLWANEKLMLRAFGKVSDKPDPSKPDPKNPLAHLPPEKLPPISFAQLAKLNEALRDIGLDPSSPEGVAGSEAAPGDDAAVQPAPAVPEAGDVP